MSLSPDHSTAGSLLCIEDAGEAISDHHPSPPSPPTLWPPSDETNIAELIDAEPDHMPAPDYLQRCRDRAVDITARLDAINWILKVQAFYRFRPVTAFLAINYMDRFLSCASLPRSSGWAFQLLSVACLSVAAKMEEPEVPLLLDLQLFEPRFVFEPKTVQRMELWLMSNLSWRLRSVSPFDFLHYFFNNLPSPSSSSSASSLPQSINHLFSTASDLVLATTRVIEFLEFPPSTVAAAAVLCSAGHPHSPMCFHTRIDHEMVRRCHQLMEEYVVDTCPASTNKASRGEPPTPPPQSPVGVLDAATCASCDTLSDRNYPGSIHAEQAQAQTEAQAEPPNKRLRSSAPDVQQR